MLGQVHVELDLATQPAPHPERDAEQDQVEGCQPDQEVPIEDVEPGIDVGLDRRVRQVDLEDTDALALVPGDRGR